MDDEFKKIKFRNNGTTYTAHAINLSNNNNAVNGNFLVWIGAFRIFDDDDKDMVGKICFQQSMLLNYLWADPEKKRFPPKEYLEEALVNLLHYVPFDKDTLVPDGESFIFRLIRDLEDDRQKDARIYNIRVEISMEKTYQRIMFNKEINEDKVFKSILEPLYMHRLVNFSTNLQIDLIRSIIPFDQNKIYSSLEELEYYKYVEILKNSTGEFVSAKITPKGVEFLTESIHKGSELTMVKKIQIGNNFNIKSGNNSPININSDIDLSFDNIRKEIESKNPQNKAEIIKDLTSLQEEIKTPKDIGKISLLLGKLGATANWVARRVEPIVQQVIASYISSQLPLPIIK